MTIFEKICEEHNADAAFYAWWKPFFITSLRKLSHMAKPPFVNELMSNYLAYIPEMDIAVV